MRVVTIALGEEADPGIEELARSPPSSVLRYSSDQGDGGEELLCSGQQPARGHEVTRTGGVCCDPLCREAFRGASAFQPAGAGEETEVVLAEWRHSWY